MKMNEMNYVIPSLIIFLLVTGALATFLGMSGKIKIERPYLEEYKQAKSDLKECTESKTPACAPCGCDCGLSGIFYTTLGLIFYAGGIFFLFWNTRKKNQKKK